MNGSKHTPMIEEKTIKAPTPPPLKYLDNKYLSKWLEAAQTAGGIRAIKNQFI